MVDYDTDYPGEDLEFKNDIFMWKDCAEFCNQKSDCKKWTWNNSTGNNICHLKSGNATFVTKRDYMTSGIRCNITGDGINGKKMV